MGRGYRYGGGGGAKITVDGMKANYKELELKTSWGECIWASNPTFVFKTIVKTDIGIFGFYGSYVYKYIDGVMQNTGHSYASLGSGASNFTNAGNGVVFTCNGNTYKYNGATFSQICSNGGRYVGSIGYVKKELYLFTSEDRFGTIFKVVGSNLVNVTHFVLELSLSTNMTLNQNIDADTIIIASYGRWGQLVQTFNGISTTEIMNREIVSYSDTYVNQTYYRILTGPTRILKLSAQNTWTDVPNTNSNLSLNGLYNIFDKFYSNLQSATLMLTCRVNQERK